MADIDFITTYLPSISELDPTEVTDTRDRLERFSRTGFPDLDTSPNTVLGDLILTPQAYCITALEKGLDRFMSDLDLGNVAKDVIFNCDFVSKYIENFAVHSPDSLGSSGVVRLTFADAEEHTIDRGTEFQLSSSVFSIYLPCTGPFHILPPGSLLQDGVNGCVLTDTGTGTYYADIPLIGPSNGELNVTEGAAAKVSDPTLAAGIQAASALVTFNPGVDTASLPELARRARITTHSASLNTRNGAISYMNGVCPFVQSVYATMSGDKEMVRDRWNAYGVSTGAMDIYTRSTSYEFVETQQVKLEKAVVGEENGVPVYDTAYRGAFHYTGQPYFIESVTHPSLPDINNIETAVITSSFPEQYKEAAAYTKYEALSIEVPDTEDANGDSVYEPNIAEDGTLYTWFTVTYRTDPMQPALSSTVMNQDYRPVNADILSRGFIPVIIEKFNVRYTREPGRLVDFDAARDAIRAYFGALGAPDAYSDGEIAKIMHEAGAKYMKGVDVKAHVQWAIGTKVKIGDAEAVPVHAFPVIDTTAKLRVDYASDAYAATIRNVRYYTMEDSVTFNEEREM